LPIEADALNLASEFTFHIFGSSVVGSIFKEIKVSLGD
jgi:hypothetical protein